METDNKKDKQSQVQVGNFAPDDSDKKPLDWQSPQVQTDIGSSKPTYKEAAGISLGISIVFFGSGVFILLLAALVEPMLAWLLLGWFLFLPIYLMSIGVTLLDAFSARNKGKLITLWIGVFFGLLCIGLVGHDLVIHSGLIHTQENTGSGGTTLAVLVSILGIFMAVKGYRTKKWLSIVVIVLCTLPFVIYWVYLNTIYEKDTSLGSGISVSIRQIKN